MPTYELEEEKIKPWKYEAKRLITSVQCPYCEAFYEVELLAGVDSSIENPIRCPNCNRRFHIWAGVYYNKEKGVIKEVYIDVHEWDGRPRGWPVIGPIDMSPLYLKGGSYSSYYYDSEGDPKVGVRGRVHRVGPR